MDKPRTLKQQIQDLHEAIEFAENYRPLPRCKHGTALKDGAGDLLEPSCGCLFINGDTYE